MLGVTRLCLLGWLVGVATGRGLEVRTSLGRIRGRWRHTAHGATYAAFNGVPYALPPLGQLRFQEAVEMNPYGGVLDATRESDDCLQLDHIYNQYPIDLSRVNKVVGSEDCLYLNVYSPQAAIRGEKNLPVMVFIHGGAFLMGSGSSKLHNPELIVEKNVVLVTINYRLDVLGFLRLDDSLVPGNLGLKDQVAALRWINKNIASFGGNPESVTIFGESAGGASTHLLMHVPSAQGLFHKVISQSGTVDGPWVVSCRREAKQHADKILSKLGCDAEPAVALACLRSKSSADIILAANELKISDIDMMYRPVMEAEGGFLTRTSIDQRSSLPWMTGVNSAEGYVILAEILRSGDYQLTRLNENFRDFLSGMFKYASAKDKDAISEAIKEKYLGDQNFSMESVKQIIKMVGDGMFSHPMEVSAKKHKGPVYRYYFSYVGERSISLLSSPAVPPNLGAAHGDELIYLMLIDKLFPNSKFNQQDSKVSELLLDLWTSFAANGKPRSDWSAGGMKEVSVSGELVSLSEEPYKLEYQLWQQVSEARSHRVKDEL